MWLIFHHSLPVKKRLYNHGHPDVIDPFCPHHVLGDKVDETIDKAADIFKDIA